MSQNKTTPTTQAVADFLASVQPDSKARDAQLLDTLFQRVTGFTPQMWGASIIGYGRYHYRYETGRTGDFLATGFSPRKARHSIYIMPGYQDYGSILARLGKHRLGKSCLYVNKLADIDMEVLAELIETGLKDLNARWPVQPD